MASKWQSTAYIKRTNAANLNLNQGHLSEPEVTAQTDPNCRISVRRDFENGKNQRTIMLQQTSEENGAAPKEEYTGVRSISDLSPVSKKHPSSFNTPLAVLHQVTSKANAKVTFPVEEDIKCSKTAPPLFKCVVNVLTSFGHLYEGTGVGTTKQNARHAAARHVLLQLDPKAESYMTPELGQPIDLKAFHEAGSTIKVVSSKEGPFLHPETRGSSETAYEKKGAPSAVMKETETNEGEQTVNVYEEQDRILIEIKKVPSLETCQNTSAHAAVREISLKEKVEMVRGWSGPKVQKLKSYPEEALVDIKNPFAIAGKVAAEQNLNLDFVVFQDKNLDGYVNETYTCVIEVSSDSSQDEPSSFINFTAFGFGDNEEEAKTFAGIQFLKMIRMILNS